LGQHAYRRLGQLGFPVGVDVLAAVCEVPRPEATDVVAALAGRSLVEVLPDGRFDMLSPVRAHARRRATDDDPARARRSLLEWADTSAPRDVNYGAADAPWLAELPAMRRAVLWGCTDEATRDRAYSVANRIFSSLYTAMRARDAVEILEGVVASGDGPPAIGAQVARRAGIAASEVRGTYEGLWLLDRADEHAAAAADPDDQRSMTAAIRAEMHLDAGDLAHAEEWALKAVALGRRASGSIVRQATRTLADLCVSSGRFTEAVRHVHEAMPTSEANDEPWIALSLRTLLARIALEQGRVAEAVAATRAVVTDARDLAEDRVGLLAQTLLRELDRSWTPPPVDQELLPWAIRLPVLAQDARDLFAAGEVRRAAGLAADVVALADSARLGRDAVEARLLLGRALLADGDAEQAASTFLMAAEQAAAMPMPLRVADALDGLASVAQRTGLREHRTLAATAAALRAPRQAAAWGYAERFAIPRARSAPDDWVAHGDLTGAGLTAVAALFSGWAPGEPSPLSALTAAERQVAERVAAGLTSRQIAEDLVVSPRTVDAHLTHIYRKLDINSRARLAAMVVHHR
jgi:DNA-binding CsgD family transcriptional regulator/tetratricopeptide (TPR) repeat protein